MKMHKNNNKFRWYQTLVLLFALSQAGLTVAAVKDQPAHLVLTQQQWSIPRTAESILTMPAIHKVMNRLLHNKQSGNNQYSLVIRYSGGEEGMLWASELKGWLVSLGLASAYIELQPGSRNKQEIELSINKILY